MDGITHAMRRERWKTIIKECNESGMKKAYWLAAHNINSKTYYNWQRKLRMEIGAELVLAQNNAIVPAQNSTDFCQLTQPVGEISEVTEKTAAVIKSGNVSVEINEEISDDLLIRLMKAVSHV
ncbi:MAG: hypothetical protein K6F23_10120 [Solobacterium sp.]|nr:hypothetical protein [Solobacterium sp.]